MDKQLEELMELVGEAVWGLVNNYRTLDQVEQILVEIQDICGEINERLNR